jgi:hypothetical protein
LQAPGGNTKRLDGAATVLRVFRISQKSAFIGNIAHENGTQLLRMPADFVHDSLVQNFVFFHFDCSCGCEAARLARLRFACAFFVACSRVSASIRHTSQLA